MTTNEKKTGIEGRLAGAWRRERIFFGTRGFVHFALWTALLLAADFLVDWRAHLSGPGRVGLLVLNAAALLAVLYFYWWRHLKKHDVLRIALQVERLYPRLRSLLVSYVQLSSGAGDAGASPVLVEAMRKQAIAEASPLDFGKIVRFRSLRHVLLSAVAALAVVTGLALWKQDYGKAFLFRMAYPAADIGYPTRTRVEPLTRDLVVQQGRTVTLRAAVSGAMPERGFLTIRTNKGNPDTVAVPVVRGSAGGMAECVYRMEEAYRDFTYSFHAGDGESKTHSVTVIAPPRVTPRIELAFPAYTRREPKPVDTLSFEVLQGGSVTWRMQIDRPLSAATLVREGGASVPMALSPDGRTATVTLAADQTFSYGFRWEERQYRFTFAPDVRYSVSVVPDSPPGVALVSPSQDEKATIRKVVDVAFDSRDDYGVSSAQIVYKIQSPAQPTGGDEQRLPVRTYTNALTEIKDVYRWDVKGSIPSLKEGDVLVYAIEVSDTRAPTPNATRSATRRLSILSAQDYVRDALEKRRQLLDRIRTIHSLEGEAADAVGKLTGKEPPKKETPK